MRQVRMKIYGSAMDLFKAVSASSLPPVVTSSEGL